MSNQQPDGGRRRRRQPERRPHHISSIAHLFFADDEGDIGVAGRETNRHFTVTCFNESRISAFACAGLVTGARVLAKEVGRWGVLLEEDQAVLWSAGSFLPEDGTTTAGGPARPGTNLSAWEWPGHGVAGQSAGLMRGRHLQALTGDGLTNLEIQAGSSRAAGTSWAASAAGMSNSGLVVCLLAGEMGQWGTAFRLGRLLGLLAPQLLEILVFPDHWATGGRPARQSLSEGDRSAGPSPELLARCRGLTRAVAGACPVTITTLPTGDHGDREKSPGTILRKMAARLAADF